LVGRMITISLEYVDESLADDEEVIRPPQLPRH
jgi:hypothetical protein